MKNRILQLLTKENISATKLAELLGVQRSNISHIISGRNKPGFDFIERLLLKFPDLSADWLILGKGEMYKNNNSVDNVQKQTELPSTAYKQKDIFEKEIDKRTQNELPSTNISRKSNEQNNEVTNVNNKEIEKIVIFYKNKTFSIFYPD